MISGISSSSAVYASTSASSTSRTQSSLSTDQTDLISSILSNYDASSLSEEDAQSIVAAFQDAGISPSKELESAMDEAGFSAQEVGQLAGVGPRGGGGMPPPPPSEEIDSVSSILDSLLSTDDDASSTTTTSFDDIMEYTSRILNLNEKSKDEVMSLLEKYSSTESDYTQDQKSNIVKNSLSQILSDTNNYKSVSFYG
ncbi:hypothetical protein KKG81_06000 [bacterium]|jgi:hypothetical protein|nr:hypothetical protein [bacterium]